MVIGRSEVPVGKLKVAVGKSAAIDQDKSRVRLMMKLSEA